MVLLSFPDGRAFYLQVVVQPHNWEAWTHTKQGALYFLPFFQVLKTGKPLTWPSRSRRD